MSTNEVPYQGIWPALLTPLNADLTINIPAFAAHALSLLAAGCSGVTPFGTTGEGPSFSVAGRILVSTSCAALPDTVALTRHAVRAGTRA